MYHEKIKRRFVKLASFFREKLDYSVKTIKICHNNEWRTIQDKEEIEHAILRHSQQHFKQAEGSLPTISPMVDILQDGHNNN